jgi:hypothetical protein
MRKLIKQWWQKIRSQLRLAERSMSNHVPNDRNQASATPGQPVKMTSEMIVDLMHRLEETQEGSYSCADAFALLDEYVELVVDDEQAAQLMPLVKNHFDICPDCREKFEVLLHILKSEKSPPKA